jgi:hypothetical protein
MSEFGFAEDFLPAYDVSDAVAFLWTLGRPGWVRTTV